MWKNALQVDAKIKQLLPFCSEPWMSLGGNLKKSQNRAYPNPRLGEDPYW